MSMISKAGLKDADADKVHNIIKEASKQSEYYKSEEKKLDAVKEKVEKYKRRVE